MTTENLPATHSDKQPALSGGAFNPFIAAAETLGISDNKGYKSFANFKQGVYLHGKNKEEIPAGTEMVFNPEEANFGWQCWINGKPKEVKSLFMAGPTPQLEDLPEVQLEDDDEWKPKWDVPMAELNGDKEYLLSFSSATSNKAFYEFMMEWSNQRKFNLDEEGEYMFPVVTIDKERREAKGDDGKPFSYFVPVLDIVDWISKSEMELVTEENEQQAIEEIEEFEEDEEEDEEEAVEEEEAPKPVKKKKTRVKKADSSLVEPAVTPTKLAITRRRRGK